MYHPGQGWLLAEAGATEAKGIWLKAAIIGSLLLLLLWGTSSSKLPLQLPLLSFLIEILIVGRVLDLKLPF